MFFRQDPPRAVVLIDRFLPAPESAKQRHDARMARLRQRIGGHNRARIGQSVARTVDGQTFDELTQDD